MILSFGFAGDMSCLEHDLEYLKFFSTRKKSDLSWAQLGGLEGCHSRAVA